MVPSAKKNGVPISKMGSSSQSALRILRYIIDFVFSLDGFKDDCLKFLKVAAQLDLNPKQAYSTSIISLAVKPQSANLFRETLL